MFKNLERKWNAHTPVYLHNGTKENFIFQLSLVGVIFIGIAVAERVEERRYRKANTEIPNKI